MASAIFKTTVNYGSQTIELRDDADVDKVEDAIVTALRAGGGWVSLPLAVGSRLILVTAGVPIDLHSRTHTPSNRQAVIL